MPKHPNGEHPSRGAVSCNGGLLWKRAYKRLADDLGTTQGMLTYNLINAAYGKQIAELMDELRQRNFELGVTDEMETL